MPRFVLEFRWCSDIIRAYMKKLFLMTALWGGICVTNISCQVGYLINSAYNQFDLLTSGESVDKLLESGDLTDNERKQLALAQSVRKFAKEELNLNVGNNYSEYVKLNRDYVTYVVNASEKWRLQSYEWWFPIVGSVPYKGYFNEADAKAEEQRLKAKDLDTYVRGVSAFSTLGWFRDPLLSSMLRYAPHELVNTLIHESTHATLYIKSSADFNERMATFVGNKGMEMYYLKIEGPDSPTLKAASSEVEDDKLFSVFITGEVKKLEEWYQTLPEEKRTDAARAERLAQIQERFQVEVQPQLKSNSYERFSKASINNARMVLYKTYLQNLSDFEKLYEMVGRDIHRFIDECKKLEDHKDPEVGLKELIRQ